jgi:hypothetical protein
MTEQEWLTSDDAVAMYWWVHGLRGRGLTPPPFGRRLSSLFAVACVRATAMAGHPLRADAADAVERAAGRRDPRSNGRGLFVSMPDSESLC